MLKNECKYELNEYYEIFNNIKYQFKKKIVNTKKKLIKNFKSFLTLYLLHQELLKAYPMLQEIL